jgi:hypothetical protein
MLRQERIEQDLSEVKKSKATPKTAKGDMFAFEEDDEGWADDVDDDQDEEMKQKVKLAVEAKLQKKRDRAQLEKATGKSKIKLEGIDKGVIGQKWVEATLQSSKVWPPKDLGLLAGTTYECNGKQVSPLEHLGLRRSICMITGRLNSMLLNTHPELCKYSVEKRTRRRNASFEDYHVLCDYEKLILFLLLTTIFYITVEAGSKQLVNPTYFKGSMEFRGRCALLLKAALQTAVAC